MPRWQSWGPGSGRMPNVTVTVVSVRSMKGCSIRPFGLLPLAQAVLKDKLITFERMHPSIALLPSQEDAALAFAQVSTFVQAFYGTPGFKSPSCSNTSVSACTPTRNTGHRCQVSGLRN